MEGSRTDRESNKGMRAFGRGIMFSPRLLAREWNWLEPTDEGVDGDLPVEESLLQYERICSRWNDTLVILLLSHIDEMKTQLDGKRNDQAAFAEQKGTLRCMALGNPF